MDGYPDDLLLAAPDWPAGGPEPRPGDLKHFVPQGFGLGAPAIITAYSGAPSDDFYGFDRSSDHPILNGPVTESSAGTIYFDDNASPGSLRAAFDLIGVNATSDYAAFAGSAANSVEERCLDQLRLVSSGAMEALFRCKPAYKSPAQRLSIPDALLAFIESQKAKWNDSYTLSSKLSGTAGGDGDWAKESLAFGLHVENTYWGVYRIWSRPWLVTK